MIIMDCSVVGCSNVVDNCSSALYANTDLRICDEHAETSVIGRLRHDGDTLFLDEPRLAT